MTTAKEILIRGLRDMDADGLCNPLPCGCGIDDIAPCGSILMTECIAANLKDGKFYPMEEQ